MVLKISNKTGLAGVIVLAGLLVLCEPGKTTVRDNRKSAAVETGKSVAEEPGETGLVTAGAKEEGWGEESTEEEVVE